MKNAQSEVVAWWYGRRDYRSGIELLSRYCKNKTIVNTLSKHGKENFQASVKKLHYEVTKAVQLDWLHMPDDILSSREDEKEITPEIPSEKIKVEIKESAPDNSFQPEEKIKIDDINQYPRVIRRLKYEYSNLYNKRSRLHNAMQKVEQTNTDANNKHRSEMLVEIKALTNKLVYYYQFIENYENNGVVPDETEVWPPEKVKEQEEPLSLPEQIKLKASLQRLNFKDNCLLDYQQRKKAEKKNPMPKGNRRDAIELRVKLRNIRISELASFINQSENAG